MIPPRAGAIAYMRYGIDINSTELVEKLLHEKSTLIVPGDQFGMDHYLRIGYGTPADYLKAGLDRIHVALLELQPA
jgi:aspartate/methionine/tyrosine aminotransferase